MKVNFLLFLFLLSFYSYSQIQNREVVLTQGDNQQDFNDAINDVDVKTIVFATDIEISSPITVPSDKVLRFISDYKIIISANTLGSITFDNTIIDAEKFQIIQLTSFGANYSDKVSKIKGKVKNDKIYPEWFGATSIMDASDDSYAIQIAINKIDANDKFKVLYPLQVQPEENIDVWGRERRDQFEI